MLRAAAKPIPAQSYAVSISLASLVMAQISSRQYGAPKANNTANGSRCRAVGERHHSRRHVRQHYSREPELQASSHTVQTLSVLTWHQNGLEFADSPVGRAR